MRLDPLVRDYPAFLDELIAVLDAPDTRIYLDTSLLMWLIKVGDEARTEFLSWTDSRPAGSVTVPVWAAHELHKHLSAGTVAKNVRTTLSEIEKKFDEFVMLAAERADGRACTSNGFSSREDYLGSLQQSKAQFLRMAKTASINEIELRLAAEAVINFANSRMLDTDLRAIMADLKEVGQFRYDHRVPPGFQDLKEENRFGDLLIWEEILSDMDAARKTRAGGIRRRPLARNAIFVSRDKKTDWVTGASMITSGEATVTKADRNVDQDVTLPHPLLLHEFQRRTGAQKIYVVHPGFLATTLDLAARRLHRPSPSRAWMTATHRPGLTVAIDKALEKLTPASTISSPSTNATQPNESAPAVTPPPSGFDWMSVLVTDMVTLSVTTQIAAYRDALPTDLADLLADHVANISSGALNPFAFGKFLAELSAQGFTGWPEELPTIMEALRQIDLVAAQKTLLSFMANSYFDRFSEIRNRPLSSLVRASLIFENEPIYRASFSTLATLIGSADIKLPYLPGSGAKVRYSLDVAAGPPPSQIRDIRVGSQSALVDQMDTESPRRFTALLRRDPDVGCSGEELRGLLAREYLIPPNLLATNWDSKKLTWSETSGLASLDPFSDGGISTDNGDEEND
jgi:hypothetical protein